MKKIGILGGTFNPIHNGHLWIAKEAQVQFALDEVWFIPSGNPPHKEVLDTVTSQQRYDMVSLAIEEEENFFLLDHEIHQKKPCYSWKTMKELHESYGKTCMFYFILGEDSFYAFEHWVKPEKICQYAKILVARRLSMEQQERHDLTAQGEAAEEQKKELEFTRMLDYYRSKFQQDFFEIRVTPMEVSSSEIRRNVYDRDFARSVIPDPVRDYIYEHQLYAQDFSADMFKKMERTLEKELNPHRYTHTLGVMYTAAGLAFAYRFPHRNAMMAGLLHDCAKCLSDEERLSLCEEYGISVSDIEKRQPHLLHGKVGAMLAKEKYHVTDPSLLHAITVHTTGAPQMSLLDKILFVSDYIEPGRDKAQRLDVIRAMAYRDLDRCVYMILEDTIKYLRERKETDMDPLTIESYQYYKKIIEERNQ